MGKTYIFNPDYAVRPGLTVDETREALCLTKVDMAERMGITVQTLDRIISGTQPITADTAQKLELVTGVNAAFWSNLEAQYQAQLLKVKRRERLSAEIAILDEYPIREMKSRGFIPCKSSKSEELEALLSFFGVASIDILRNKEDELRQLMAARESRMCATDFKAVVTWFRMIQQGSRKIECAPFDADRLRAALSDILRIANSEDQDGFSGAIRKAQQILASSGVALVVVKAFPGVSLNGVSSWETPRRALIGLTVRGGRVDAAWFTLLHEIYHILNGKKKMVYVNADEADRSPSEIEADEFAASTIIPHKHDDEIRACRTVDDIKRVAVKTGVSSMFIAGRNAYLTGCWSRFALMRGIFKWGKSTWTLTA